MFSYTNPFYTLRAGGAHALTYRAAASGEAIPFAWPAFEIDGRAVTAAPEELTVTDRRF